jgi:acyl-CoA reductase-like NAD-dependent aldehyde dehydrogenase
MWYPCSHFLYTVVDAALGEIITTCSKMEWLLKHGERALRPSTRRTPLILIHKSSKVYYEPLGVVAAIVSWNYRQATFGYIIRCH